MHKQPPAARFPHRRRPAARKCYCCDSTPTGFALRDRDGGPALGSTIATCSEVLASDRTIWRAACGRHAWPAKWLIGGGK